jgi:hypothetical protein
MKYLLFNILADGTPTTRFARELTIAIDDAGEALRVLPLGQTKIGEDVFFLSTDFLEERYHRIISLMWGPPTPGKEMYVFGDVKEVVQRILRKEDCAPVSYAFITLAGWENKAERLALSRGLLNYDRVFVFSEADQASLAAMNVESEIVGDVKEYITIERRIEAQAPTGRLLVVVPTDGTQSEDFIDAFVAAAQTEIGEQDAVWAVEVSQAEWNMSFARNLGIKKAYEEGFDYIAFQDIDIETPPGYYSKVKQILAETSDNVVVPPFVGVPSGIGGNASGNVAMHVEKALEVDGYDEYYIGGGSEDIDFLFRLNRDTVCFEITPDTAPLKHYDHEPRGDRSKYDLVNEARVKKVMDYMDLETKSILKDLKDE